MLRYIIIRFIWIFIVLFTFLSILFVTIRLVPEYPPTDKDQKEIYYEKLRADGYYYTEVIKDPAEVARIRRGQHDPCKKCYYKDETNQYRVYKPVPIASQYVRWVKNVLGHWNWGVSTRVQPNRGVFELAKERLPHTLKLNLIALFIYIPIGFTFGIIAALKKDKLVDNIISLGVMIFISIPNFVLLFIFILVFAYGFKWLPTNWLSSDIKGIGQYTQLILPVLALSFGEIAYLTRLTRAELTEVLTSEFLLLARTKGLTRRQAVVRHALRNSLVPLVPSIIFSFVALVSGSMVIERVYSIPGMGSLYFQALTLGNMDYNVILALSAFYTSISLFAVLLVDLSYGLVDPRIRMGARK
ncbi:MAG: ABC transporter permease [Bacilli bacterium]|nr:ABC transporter permease [Bacilli bacterium]